MKIITITLNPAIDLHIQTENLTVGDDNPARVVASHSGGKGVNVSRALHVNGVPNLCYMVLGEENGEEFVSSLMRIGMRTEYDTVPGFVRENINIHANNGETVIATEGPAIDGVVLRQVRDKLLRRMVKNTVVAFCGRISTQTDKETVIRLLLDLKRAGAALVLDSKSFTSEDIKRLSPYLIKPNILEAEALVGVKIDSVNDAACVAEKIRDMGVDNVMISLGEGGVLLLSPDGAYHAQAESVQVVSSVGAGDSTIAGFLLAALKGQSAEKRAAYAAAFGTAACLEEGTEPPKPETVERVLKTVKITKM